ncbi:hypothetical protein [Enterococcus sp. LJL90]
MAIEFHKEIKQTWLNLKDKLTNTTYSLLQTPNPKYNPHSFQQESKPNNSTLYSSNVSRETFEE